MTTERNIGSKYGTFHFSYIDYPGPSPLVDIYLDETHIGYADYINLDEASDLELLQIASQIDD